MTIIRIAAASVLFIFAFLLVVQVAQPISSAGPGTKVRLKIDGMTCGGCQKKVETAVAGIKGVEGVVVNTNEGWAEVSYVTASMNPDELVTAVRDAGFHASVATVPQEGQNQDAKGGAKTAPSAEQLARVRAELATVKEVLMKQGKYSCCTGPACDFCALAIGGCDCGEKLLKGQAVCGDCADGWAAGMGMIPDIDPANVQMVSNADLKNLYKQRAEHAKKAQKDEKKKP